MRHASTRFTIEIYTQARIEAKPRAQQRLVQTILSEENEVPPVIEGRSDVSIAWSLDRDGPCGDPGEWTSPIAQ
jgi:hypothetical protein